MLKAICHIQDEKILMIDEYICFSPENISNLSDNQLISALRYWEKNGELIYRNEHAKYQQSDLGDWPRSGVVYFVLRSDGLIKIGFTRRLKQRYERLSEQHGKLKILHEIKSDLPFELEQQIHKELNEYHVKYEWFNLPPEVVEEYKSNGKAQNMDQGQTGNTRT